MSKVILEFVLEKSKQEGLTQDFLFTNKIVNKTRRWVGPTAYLPLEVKFISINRIDDFQKEYR
jgi:hypothetical protein